ncbi:hypothetical protein HN51_040916, partial [Arachis hypogaea]
MEGCSNLGGFVFCLASLTTLWLSDLYSLSKMIDRTEQALRGNFTALRLSHDVVLALIVARLRFVILNSIFRLGLRMLSLVAAIASSYPNVELLDLSGSGRSDSGIGIICNVFPETLSRLLLALCPNVTSSGIQFATAQLLLLELMDCGMTIRDPDSLNPTTDEDDFKPQETFSTNMHLTNQ